MSAPIPLEQMPDSDPAEWTEEDMANAAILEAILYVKSDEDAETLELLEFRTLSHVQETGEPIVILFTHSAQVAARMAPGMPLQRFLSSLLEKRCLVLLRK